MKATMLMHYKVEKNDLIFATRHINSASLHASCNGDKGFSVELTPNQIPVIEELLQQLYSLRDEIPPNIEINIQNSLTNTSECDTIT